MPGTFTGLLLFVVCLAPGFVYAAVRDIRLPERVSTPFRETARVVLASVVFDVMGLVLFVGARAVLPSITPDIGRWVREGSQYVAADYTTIAAWGALTLATATAAAALAARTLPRVNGPLTVESSWWLLFHVYPRQVSAAAIYVECELTDGSYIAGTLQNFAHQAEETPGRELALVAPLVHRSAPGEASKPLASRTFAAVRAEQIKFLTVTYLDNVP
ncbi:DUF6338 family protein [Streptomyces sp. NBC_01102]|uniref:DUF6338 family protein n=1 Tax=Streptomyces sp. NBC_01102 TaxID=2903749 RepID=UPI00386E2674|nr:DUF6338 family protein [Streptomyces sp. NBC_01102]